MKKTIAKKSTIYDIAARAGTSTATVSRVLANTDYPVSDELRQRILDAAAELHYSPNVIGRMLKKSESTDIGVIIPTISNPFYSMLLLGAEQEAGKEGYSLFLCNSLRDEAAERRYLESLHQKQVRGIMVSTVSGNAAKLAELQKYGVKIVAFDEAAGDIRCGRIGFDYRGGAMLAVDHLVENGHRDIAFLSAPITRRSREEVLAGYRQALARHGLLFRQEYVMISETEEELANGTYEFENGKRLAAAFLRLPRRPTAILAINDLTACGVMQALIAGGVRVPQDVSVVGFDNIELAAMVNPPLTTVNQPAFETGRLACRMLLDAIRGLGKEDAAVTMEPELVVRGSVRRIAQQQTI